MLPDAHEQNNKLNCATGAEPPGQEVGQADQARPFSRQVELHPFMQSRRVAANLKAPALVLAAEDIAAIDALERGERLVSPDFAPAWDC